MSKNLRFEQADAALTATNGAYTLLRGEVNAAIARLTEAQAALRLGRVIDAHEHLLDLRADLMAALAESA